MLEVVEKFLQENKLIEANELLLALFSDREFSSVNNALVLLSSRLTGLVEQHDKSIIAYSEYSVEMNKLRVSYTSMLEQIRKNQRILNHLKTLVLPAKFTQLNNTVVNNVYLQNTPSAPKPDVFDPFASNPKLDKLVDDLFVHIKGFFVFSAKHGDVLEELAGKAEEKFFYLVDLVKLVVNSTDLNKLAAWEKQLPLLSQELSDLHQEAKEAYSNIENSEKNVVLQLVNDTYKTPKLQWEAFKKAYAKLEDEGKANFKLPSDLPSTKEGIAFLRRKFVQATMN